MKLIIADDHALFRETLAEFAERHFSEAHIKFSDDFDGVLEIMKQAPEQDLVLLDLRMPGMHDMQGFHQMRDLYPHTKVALMSGMAEPSDVRSAIDSGAVGYFPKTLGGKDFVRGIKQVVEGTPFVPVDPKTNIAMASYKNDENQHNSPQKKNGNAGLEEEQVEFVTSSSYSLTFKESEVLSYLVQGLANKEIAIHMAIQEVTVKLHVRGICQKLDVKNRTQAALKARELGLIS